MKSTQSRKSVWSRLLRGPSRPPRAKGCARLAAEPLENRCLPAQLPFLTQPLSTATGLTLNPVPVSSSAGGTVPITLSLGNNQSGLQLAGTVTKNAINGQATFDHLVLYGGNGEPAAGGRPPADGRLAGRAAFAGGPVRRRTWTESSPRLSPGFRPRASAGRCWGGCPRPSSE